MARWWSVSQEQRDMYRAGSRNYYWEHRDELRTRSKKYQSENRVGKRHARKLELLEMLGPFCNLCGESDPSVLQFDHIAPLYKHERSRTSDLLALLRSGEESPFNLQVLCANCHARKTNQDRINFSRFGA